MRLLAFLLIVFLLMQVFVEASSLSDETRSLSKEDAGGNTASLHKKPRFPRINCNHACLRRCSRSSRKNLCHRACKSCCFRCHCVPPGTYGNKALCPCYASLRTHGNRPKCP